VVIFEDHLDRHSDTNLGGIHVDDVSGQTNIRLLVDLYHADDIHVTHAVPRLIIDGKRVNGPPAADC
jgi:hypothetical protein